MANVFQSLFAADHAVGQGELSQSISFIGKKGCAGFVVSRAIVGEIPLAEEDRIDGMLDTLDAPVVVLVSECPYRPFIGQKIRLASGRVVRVHRVSDDPAGVTYPIMVGPENG